MCANRHEGQECESCDEVGADQSECDEIWTYQGVEEAEMRSPDSMLVSVPAFAVAQQAESVLQLELEL